MTNSDPTPKVLLPLSRRGKVSKVQNMKVTLISALFLVASKCNAETKTLLYAFESEYHTGPDFKDTKEGNKEV